MFSAVSFTVQTELNKKGFEVPTNCLKTVQRDFQLTLFIHVNAMFLTKNRLKRPKLSSPSF